MPRRVRVECDHCRRGLDRIRGGGLRLLVRAEPVAATAMEANRRPSDAITPLPE